jgi:hypothetical protein
MKRRRSGIRHQRAFTLSATGVSPVEWAFTLSATGVSPVEWGTRVVSRHLVGALLKLRRLALPTGEDASGTRRSGTRRARRAPRRYPSLVSRRVGSPTRFLATQRRDFGEPSAQRHAPISRGLRERESETLGTPNRGGTRGRPSRPGLNLAERAAGFSKNYGPRGKQAGRLNLSRRVEPSQKRPELLVRLEALDVLYAKRRWRRAMTHLPRMSDRRPSRKSI